MIGDGSQEDAINTLRSIYSAPVEEPRDADGIILDGVCNWRSRVNDFSGLRDVASVLNIAFMQEKKAVLVWLIATCIEAIEVPLPEGLKGKYAESGGTKSDLVDKLFRLWSAHGIVTTTKGFVGRLFSESVVVRIANFKKFCSSDMLNSIEPGEAKKMASFLSPDKPTTPFWDDCTSLVAGISGICWGKLEKGGAK